MNLSLRIIGLCICLFFSAFFAASETAISSINKIRFRELVKKENWRKEYNRLLTTILIGNNVVNISASTLAASIGLTIFKSKGIAIATGVMIFLILVFGEITPKIFSKIHAEAIAERVIGPLMVFSLILSPINRFFIRIAQGIIKAFTFKKVSFTPFVTERELKMFVDIGEKEGVVQPDEKKMIHSIFRFGDTRVVQVMINRKEMVAVSEEKEIADILDLAISTGYTRIPVYRQDLDHITGIIYVKDLLLAVKKREIKISHLLRPAYFVPAQMKVNQLLKEFQKRKIHLGIVQENSRTLGLVTLEDLMEEIVGEIRDEYDTDEQD